MSFWVAGGSAPPSRGVAGDRVTLVPDKASYAGGDTADVLVQAPFYPAEGVVTLRRNGIAKVEHLAMTGPTATLHVPIADAMTPDVWLQVELVGQAARAGDDGEPDPSLPKRPAYAVGAVRLAVPPLRRALAVTVAPRAAKVAPGERAEVAVAVADAAGAPVAGAEVAVIVVDEAVLALAGTGYDDPLAAFYPARDPGVADRYSREHVQLGHVTRAGGGGPGHTRTGRGFRNRRVVEQEMPDPNADEDADGLPDVMDKTVEYRPMPKKRKVAETEEDARAAGSAAGGEGARPIALRTNFRPLATFAPAVTTDAAGHATVAVKMPDNLTRYRIVAIASAGERQFGKGESAVTARLPLMVRPSPPRFLNFGDTFRLPVVVQNQTDAPMTVRVAVRATNAAITDGAGREVTVPANDRVEVQFPAAAELAGTARFQVIASSGGFSDAAEVALPVWTPATTEAFATYGTIDSPGSAGARSAAEGRRGGSIDDGAVKQPVALPGKVWPQFGGLEVTTSSTNLAGADRRAAVPRALPVRVRGAAQLAHPRDRGAARRADRVPHQGPAVGGGDGGERRRRPRAPGADAELRRRVRVLGPRLPVGAVPQRVRHQRARAREGQGLPRPTPTCSTARTSTSPRRRPHPGVLSRRRAPRDHRVRAVHAQAARRRRRREGRAPLARALGGPDKLGMETDGWLLGTLAGRADSASERAALLRHAQNSVSETAGAANFTTGYADGNHLLLASDRRVDAVMLQALIEEAPASDLVPKIVTGLLAHRTAGRWENTQESSFVLLALDTYFQTYEKTTPDFVARVWLGDAYAGDHAFRGRTTERGEIDIPMRLLAAQQDLTIQKDGKGRLYYRIGMTYAPESLRLEPADHGFVVQRRYEAVDDPKDVTRAADGTWHVRAGARVRVRVSMVNDDRRYQVALVDPMPAGFEAMNPALATTGPIPLDPKEQAARGSLLVDGGPWFEHQELHDERAEAFASLLWEGVHDYSYVARATTPGAFVVPPPKAEEMYMPETFGRGASDRVVVE